MAFQSMEDFTQERNQGRFRLADDGDTADVVFMFQNPSDAMRCDAHYITSDNYRGYVHCLEQGCPACAKGLKKQSKLFIPMYLPDKEGGEGEFVFWDRNTPFYHQLTKDVFDVCPNPSQYVFLVTRHGEYNSRDTRYQIDLIAKNTEPFEDIEKRFGISFPDAYERIVKSMDASEMRNALESRDSNGGYSSNADLDNMPTYKLTPRPGHSAAPTAAIEDSVPTTTDLAELPDF